jgi:hypothetical protein
LGFKKEAYEEESFVLLEELGFTKEAINQANAYVCGTMTVEGAPGLKDEGGVLGEKRRGDPSETQAQLRRVDFRDRVAPVGAKGAVAVRLFLTCRSVLFEGGPLRLGFLVRRRHVQMCGLPVDELAVLGAAGVLDEEHVTAARPL